MKLRALTMSWWENDFPPEQKKSRNSTRLRIGKLELNAIWIWLGTALFCSFYLPVYQVHTQRFCGMRAILPHSYTFFIRFKWNDEKTTLKLLKKSTDLRDNSVWCVRARSGWATQKLLFAISMLKWWSQMVCNKFNHLLLNHKRWVFCSRTRHAHAALLDFFSSLR